MRVALRLLQPILTSIAGRGVGRGTFPGRGPGFEGELDPSQATYGMPYPGSLPGYHPGMMGYQMGYQTPYAYGNVLLGAYGYGYPQQFHPGYQLQQGATFDPRQQAIQFQMAQAGRGYPALGQR